ncbi:PAS domain S-box protein [Mesorhizobium atlanticum]
MADHDPPRRSRTRRRGGSRASCRRDAFFEAEFRMRHKDGHWVWILDRGKMIERDAEGRVIRAIGSLTDITQRKEAEARLMVSAAMLADEKERLRVTLQSIGDAVICTDAANRITFMNPVAEKLTGVDVGEALGKVLGHVYWAVDEESGRRIGLTRPSASEQRSCDQNTRAVLVRRDDTRCSIRQAGVADHERPRGVLRAWSSSSRTSPTRAPCSVSWPTQPPMMR